MVCRRGDPSSSPGSRSGSRPSHVGRCKRGYSHTARLAGPSLPIPSCPCAQSLQNERNTRQSQFFSLLDAMRESPKKKGGQVYLIRIDKDDLFEIQGEKDIQKQDLVAPDRALLLRLSVQPRRPFVCHQFVLKTIRFGQFGQKVLKKRSTCQWPWINASFSLYLERRRQKVLNEPEFHSAVSVLHDRCGHDGQKALVQVPGRHRENIDVRLLARTFGVVLGSGLFAKHPVRVIK